MFETAVLSQVNHPQWQEGLVLVLLSQLKVLRKRQILVAQDPMFSLTSPCFNFSLSCPIAHAAR